MSGPQRLIPWLTLVMLTVVAVAGAVVGIEQAPEQATLKQAVTNTLDAPDYTSTVSTSSAAAQSQNLVYQAPDRIGGYVDTGTRRIYVAVIGSVEYQSTQVSTSRSSANLTFIKEASQPARSYDPVQGYLPYVAKGTDVTRDGDVYSFTVTQQGQTAKFTLTVSGQYVSLLTIATSGTTITLAISDVGTSPAVTLPPGAKVTSSSPPNASGAAG
jgi:hypothetical protein